MHSDPTAYILAAAIVGAAIGFIGCALFVARRIQEARDESWHDGYAAATRELESHRL